MSGDCEPQVCEGRKGLSCYYFDLNSKYRVGPRIIKYNVSDADFVAIGI